MLNSAELLCILLERMSRSNQEYIALSAQEILILCPEGERVLLSAGLLEVAQPSNSIVCPGCEEGCLQEVHIVGDVEGSFSRAFIVCNARDDIGRVSVDFGMLQCWKLTLWRTANFVAAALKLSGKPKRISHERFSIGYFQREGKRREVVLCRLDETVELQSEQYFFITLPSEISDRPGASISLLRLLECEDSQLTCNREIFEIAFSAQNAMNSEPEYLFRKERSGRWLFKFAGNLLETTINYKGLDYLLHLLKNPSKNISVFELVQIVQGAVVDTGVGIKEALDEQLSICRHEIDVSKIDNIAINQYKKKILNIDGEIEHYSTLGDVDKVEELNDYRSELLKEITTAISGKRSGESISSKKARQSVTNTIQRALKFLNLHIPPLGKHLESSISIGANCIYSPPKLPHWDF